MTMAFIVLSFLLIVSPSLQSTTGAPPKPGTTPLQPMIFFAPSNIDVDPNTGDVFVVDGLNNRVQKFTNNGQLIKSWGGKGTANGKFNWAVDVAVDTTGNIFVVDHDNYRIQKFKLDNPCPRGTSPIDIPGVCFIKSWGKQGLADDDFNNPLAAAVDSSGNVFVADKGKDRIKKFDNNGGFLDTWGGEGMANGEFNEVEDLAVDPNTGDVYVWDQQNHRIQKFDNNGGFIDVWENGFDGTNSIAVDPKTGHVFVSNSYSDLMKEFTKNGMPIKTWSTSATANNYHNDAVGVDLDSSGNVYVADTDNNRILKFANDGGFISKWP